MFKSLFKNSLKKSFNYSEEQPKIPWQEAHEVISRSSTYYMSFKQDCFWNPISVKVNKLYWKTYMHSFREDIVEVNSPPCLLSKI